ncbi:hypothetical protein EDD21DRAFT_5320 [Dissophora ornata]|nr:hypothetical protein EDD21DRAFT_5320 [Dissophora ornata]
MSECTFFECKHGFLAKQADGAKLTRDENDHIGRYHADTPVEIKCRVTGKTIMVHRDPSADMLFRCVCTKTLLPRSSVKRHYETCEKAQIFAAEHQFPLNDLATDVDGEPSSSSSASPKPFRHKKRKDEASQDDESTPSHPVASVHPTTTTPATNSTAGNQPLAQPPAMQMMTFAMQLQETVKKHEDTITRLCELLDAHQRRIDQLEQILEHQRPQGPI